MDLPLREIEATGAPDTPVWWAQIPAVRQVLSEGWRLAPITVLVGDNGAGKSTLVEAVALAYGMGPEGGSIGSGYSTRATESALQLTVRRDIGAARFGFFLRAETMHAFYSFLEDNPGQRSEPQFHRMSHGESFLSLIGDRMHKPGLYLLDEPESALSFDGCLALVAHIKNLEANDSQVLLSTHSPLLAAIPGAEIWEVGEWGMRRCEWEDLDLVRRWRGFLDDPGRFLRYFLD
ncbi:AAA family ATPase [Cellulomonas rhizosphaerae]|uniref:ATP-binding cassette domain-containing protein n=1 Tax=Cellulomonas rhizosphaerae TaxID=2293719 RepID=A0A413RQP0_9CELL|nr:AAA family ATPase [Cellulomonas rhizosphaerae]RHA44240.1 ATP-binding cassette domain-containing protein [Cellulomonas rhizosphaerae]